MAKSLSYLLRKSTFKIKLSILLKFVLHPIIFHYIINQPHLHGAMGEAGMIGV